MADYTCKHYKRIWFEVHAKIISVMALTPSLPWCHIDVNFLKNTLEVSL